MLASLFLFEKIVQSFSLNAPCEITKRLPVNFLLIAILQKLLKTQI